MEEKLAREKEQEEFAREKKAEEMRETAAREAARLEREKEEEAAIVRYYNRLNKGNGQKRTKQIRDRLNWTSLHDLPYLCRFLRRPLTTALEIFCAEVGDVHSVFLVAPALITRRLIYSII